MSPGKDPVEGQALTGEAATRAIYTDASDWS